MKRVAWFLFLILIAVSCLDQPDCFRQNNNFVGISFKKMFDGRGDTVAIVSITPTDNTSLVYYNHQLVSSISLPLNYLKDSTTYIIQGIDIEGISRMYTLSLTHKSKAQFVSSDCGEKFVLSDLLIVPNNDFDSINLVSNSLTNPAHVNINIYRCPRNNVMRFSFRQLYIDTLSQGRPDPRIINAADYSGISLFADTTLSSFLFPLNPADDKITFNFNLDNDDIRSVTLQYLVEDKTILEKCGPQKVLSKLDTIDNNFPKLIIQNDSIYDPPTTNIEVMRCPTTNEIKIAFRKTAGTSIPDVDTLTSVTADFETDLSVFADSAASVFTLPLNPDPTSAVTTFTFVIDGQTKVLQIGYVTQKLVLHNICGEQTIYTSLQVLHTDFTTSSILIKDVTFPPVNNIEIIR